MEETVTGNHRSECLYLTDLPRPGGVIGVPPRGPTNSSSSSARTIRQRSIHERAARPTDIRAKASDISLTCGGLIAVASENA